MIIGFFASQQLAISNNMDERLPKKLHRFFWASIALLRAFRCGLSAMRREQLGSKVLFNGKQCKISNWAGSQYPSLVASDGMYHSYVNRSFIVSRYTISEFAHRFRFGASFYLQNWASIHIDKRLYPEAFMVETSRN